MRRIRQGGPGSNSWVAIGTLAWAVVYKVIGSVRGFTVEDTSGSAAASVLKNVRKGEFTGKAAIVCELERLVGASGTHPAISTKQEGASYCLVGDGVYSYRKRCGRRTGVVKLNGHSGLSVCAESSLRAEAIPRSGCCRSDVGFRRRCQWLPSAQKYLGLRMTGAIPYPVGVATELRCGGGAAC